MDAFLIEWLALIGRWVHLITGIAWIGASFYFVWLDNHLLAPAGKSPDGVGGELWAVHGGGFYHSQKYRVAPASLPGTLHWFYWEAYSTWLSGMFLLCLMYYGQAEIYLVDARVAALSKPAAIVIGLAFLAGTWLLYDALCRSRLGRDDRWLGPVLGIGLAIEAYALCHIFSGRGAFIQFGAALGTIMVANVFFVIIPGQRELVKAKMANREPDPVHGLRGKQRSVHNTYLTLPVLFTMISNHYAMTYGARHNWLVLIGMCLAGALIRTWFVARHKAHERGGRTPAWPAVWGVLSIVIVAISLVPARGSPGNVAPANFAQIESIVKARCVPCHSAVPTQPGFMSPPKGIELDTPQHIIDNALRTQPLLISHTMPPGNLTGMTEEERAALLTWIDHGAHR
ncbi:MAG TPA: urate hydroxylase PuuD [Steroidobacter sp.]|uniref:urate hydroxylase PuuD n=1 Tax=Steroidobacter sp. TaxID=1978227 RepID=UPI002ED8563F